MSGGLRAEVVVRRSSFELDAAVAVDESEVLAIVGPSGAGKSTLLHAIAGLLIPTEGEVTIAGRTLTQVRKGEGARVFVPPRYRGVGLLGQDPLLFPHLSAAQNVAFGLRAQGIRPAEAIRAAEEWLASVGLAGLGHRRPDGLSGGQQQRVAIARVLATQPALLLLDEPTAALDVQTAAAIRALLKQHLVRTRTPAVIVSHNVLDAVVLADQVVVLGDGRIVESGDVGSVLGAPATPFTRSLAAAGPMPATVDADGSVRVELGLEPGRKVWVDIVS